MTPRTPERTLEQRQEALDKANATRIARSKLKLDLKAGRQSIDALILNPPEFLETAKVAEIMLAAPRWGTVKVETALRRCGVSPSKTFGGLTDRQRMETVRLIRDANASTQERLDRIARQFTRTAA